MWSQNINNIDTLTFLIWSFTLASTTSENYAWNFLQQRFDNATNIDLHRFYHLQCCCHYHNTNYGKHFRQISCSNTNMWFINDKFLLLNMILHVLGCWSKLLLKYWWINAKSFSWALNAKSSKCKCWEMHHSMG